VLNSGWARFGLANIAIASSIYVIKSSWDFAAYIFDVLIIIFIAWIVSLGMRRLVAKIKNLLPSIDQKLNTIGNRVDPFLSSLINQLTRSVDNNRNAAFLSRANLLNRERIFQRLLWASIPISYLLVLLPVVVIFVIIVPITLEQAVALSKDLPNFAETLSGTINKGEDFAASLGLTSQQDASDNATLLKAGEVIGNWMEANALDTLKGAGNILFRSALIFALSIYMVLEGNLIMSTVYKLIPENYHQNIRNGLNHLDTMFFGYLRGIFTIISLYSVIIASIMMIAGLPFALPIGILSGLIQLVPVVGEVVALGMPILVSFLTGTLSTTAFVGITLMGWSLLMNNVVLPRILGKAIQMPGLFVLLAVLLGTRLAGPWGAVLGVPVAGFIYSVVLAWVNPSNETITGNQYKLTEKEEEL
jgi:predicted PurR-regulated permease PerM